ncbi:MAG TPA: NUDIX hydrolase [Candidatus Paceibacterota bacterium]|nr:NUDIX hydrolase [Candidatus Paceibacterota bacterium]
MKTLYDGKYLSLVSRNDWEFSTRKNVKGVVEIVAITDDDELLLVEQWREPVQSRVLELPAGLVGDIDKDESFEEAAKRELIEETGYKAFDLFCILSSPASAGVSDEILTYIIAKDLEKVSEGGGDDSEDIIVHKVPFKNPFTIDAENKKFRDFLKKKSKEGVLIDSRILSGIALLFL